MALNSSGPISLGGATVGQSINLELGQAATATASINATNFRALAGVASGQISISSFYGKSNVTYYAIKLTPTSNSPWYNSQLFGLDSSGNFYNSFSTGTGQNTVFTKIAADGSSVLYQTGLKITSPGGVYGTGSTTSATSSAGNSVHIAPYFMGAYSPTQSQGVFPFYVSSAGTAIVGGGLRQYIASGQTYSYTSGGYSPGTVDSSGNFYFTVNGTAYNVQSYCPCTGNPIYDAFSAAAMLFKYNSSGNNLSQHIFATNTGGFSYGTQPIVLPSGNIILGGFNYNTTQWAIASFNSSITSTSWTNRFTFAAPWNGNAYTGSGPGFNVYNSSLNVVYSTVPVINPGLSRVGATVSSINANTGAFNWSRVIYSTVNNQGINGAATDSSGNIYVGSFNYYPTLPQDKNTIVKLNSSGTVQWQRTFQNNAGSLNLRMFEVTSAGTLAIYFSLDSGFGTAFYFMTYPLDGSKTGSVTVGGSTITIGTGITVIDTLTPTQNSNPQQFGTPTMGSNGVGSSAYSPTSTITRTAY